MPTADSNESSCYNEGLYNSLPATGFPTGSQCNILENSPNSVPDRRVDFYI